jgi:hypothetical protein
MNAPRVRVNMNESTCGWAGCSKGAEAELDARPLCRSHFFEIAAKWVEKHRESLQRTEPTGEHRLAVLKFLSELISQTTNLATRAKFLSPSQRDQFNELSTAALGLYKRVQRDPRVPLNMPILLHRDTSLEESQELTYTVDVSKKGASIATIRSCGVGEKIWIQKPTNPLRSLARVAWVKKTGPAQFLIGLDILDHENFWGANILSPVRIRKPRSRRSLSQMLPKPVGD